MTDPIPKSSPYAVFKQAVQPWTAENGVLLEDTYGLEKITYALWSMLHGVAILQLNQLKDFEADFDAANRQTLKIFLTGLRNE